MNNDIWSFSMILELKVNYKLFVFSCYIHNTQDIQVSSMYGKMFFSRVVLFNSAVTI